MTENLMEVKKQKLLFMIQPTPDLTIHPSDEDMNDYILPTKHQAKEERLEEDEVKEEEENEEEEEEEKVEEEDDDLVGIRCSAPLKEVSNYVFLCTSKCTLNCVCVCIVMGG